MKKTDFLVAVQQRHGRALRDSCKKFLASAQGKAAVKQGYVENPTGVVQEVLWQGRRRKGAVSAEALEAMSFGSMHRVTLG